MVGKFSVILSSNIFSGPFSLSSPSGTSIMQMLMHLILSQRSLRLSLFIFILFFYILFCGSDFHHSVLQVIYPSASVILLLIPSHLLNSFPKILDHLHYHNSELFLLKGYLSPLHLVVSLGFYLVPSPGTKLSAFSS